MSFLVFFEFSTGLKDSVLLPKGTLEKFRTHLAKTERILGMTRTEDEGVLSKRWDHFQSDFDSVETQILCRTVEQHNGFVRWLYLAFGELQAEYAQRPLDQVETLTPEQAATIWHGLKILGVPCDRWTGDYYQVRMEAIYAAMRHKKYGTEGLVFDAPKLTEKQAAAVINLFAAYLDHDDIRLDVPRGLDMLSRGEDHEWCTKCGAMTRNGGWDCKRRKCPLLAELKAEEAE